MPPQEVNAEHGNADHGSQDALTYIEKVGLRLGEQQGEARQIEEREDQFGSKLAIAEYPQADDEYERQNGNKKEQHGCPLRLPNDIAQQTGGPTNRQITKQRTGPPVNCSSRFGQGNLSFLSAFSFRPLGPSLSSSSRLHRANRQAAR
jgi:hypothetical protein